MKIPYKAGQLALYGSGEEIYIATANGKNRIVAFDSRAVLTLSWEDTTNIDNHFSVSVNRREFLNIVRNGQPRNGFYAVNISRIRACLLVFDHAVLSETSDPKKSFIGLVAYKEVDINSINDYYEGLVIDKNRVTGSVCLDFDKLRYVMEFLNNYVAAGRFGANEVRVVNFQTTNDAIPILCQAFVRCNQSLVCDLDVAVFPFVK